MMKNENDKLYVIHVVNENEKFLNKNSDGEALEYLFKVSKEAGAELTVLRSKNILSTMIDFSKENYITHIVMGESNKKEAKNRETIEYKLKESLPKTEFITL